MTEDQVVDKKVHLIPTRTMTPTSIAKWLLQNQDNIENIIVAITTVDGEPIVYRNSMPLKDLCYLSKVMDEDVRQEMYE